MIRNGLYHITVEMPDGIEGGNKGVMVLRDATLRLRHLRCGRQTGHSIQIEAVFADSGLNGVARVDPM
jgi:hypothetical protein